MNAPNVGKAARPDAPWFVASANADLEQRVAAGQIRSVLEFGSGGSTVFFAERGARVVSIEHQPKWRARVQAELSRRGLSAEIRLALPDQTPQAAIYRGRDKRSYRAYVKAGTAAARQVFGGRVDCILVDGRARVACVRAALRYLRPGGVLVLDDAERGAYRDAAILLASRGFSSQSFTWHKHRTDLWVAPARPRAEPHVLVLSSGRRGRRINDLLHRGFFNACPLGLTWYGPGECSGPVFKRRRPIVDVIAESGAGLVIINMRSRVDNWLTTRELSSIPVPKAIVEVDYCYADRRTGDGAAVYRGGDEWYREAGFDHVFLRHLTDVEHSQLPSRSWLPFSNDAEVFRSRGRRDIPIGFAGTLKPAALYANRRAAITALGRAVTVHERRVAGLAYAQFLSRCRVALTCGGAFAYDNAKHVQIPASGALLATDGSRGIAELLPDPDMYLRYRIDSIADQIAALLRDRTALRERAAIAQAHCKAHHIHSLRWQTLLETLRPEAPVEASCGATIDQQTPN